ncbi:response regulator [Elusimicrobiota bacterium]
MRILGYKSNMARTLVMDDDRLVARVAARMLRRMGHCVDVVRDGRDAVRAHSNAKDIGRPYDIIIMDLTVSGGMGGREATALIRKRDGEVRILAASGFHADGAMCAPEKYGFTASLTKPFLVDGLRAALRCLLRGWKSLPQSREELFDMEAAACASYRP